jgi:S-disulfanyl-L-cysteine oxidoreductase SoxD
MRGLPRRQGPGRTECPAGRRPDHRRRPGGQDVGSYWPYATTLFDFVRRAMPWNETKSLTDDEVYAVSAYVLRMNNIIGDNDVMDAKTLPQVKMPNRDGFIPLYPNKH